MTKFANIFLGLVLVFCVCGCQNDPVKRESPMLSGIQDELKARNLYVVFGCVMKQGKFELLSTGRLTVSQAILRSNGLASHADGKKVKLIRRMPDHTLRTIWVDVEAVLSGKGGKDPLVLPGDVIVVQDTTVIF